MNQNSNNVAQGHISPIHESIDLVDILKQLKRGKWIIIGFIILTTLLAVVYLFTAKEKWTSNAIVTYPDSGQIASYTNAMGVLYSQNPGNAPSITEVQQRFFGRFNSAIAALSEQLDNQESPEKLSITPASKDQAVPIKVSYTAHSAGAAQKTLTTYIQQINKRVVNELNDDLQTSIDSKIESLHAQLIAQEKVAQEKKDKRLEVLNQALIIAEQSNIKTPVVQQAESLSEDTLFVLGSNALSATIKNESTRPLPLDGSYFAAREALLALTALKSNPDVTYSIRYVMKPDLPFYLDSPKKILVISLGILLGLILGSVFVILRNAVQTSSRSS